MSALGLRHARLPALQGMTFGRGGVGVLLPGYC